MHIMNRIKLRKFERIMTMISIFIGTLAIGFVILIIISFISKELFYWLLQSIIYEIIITVIALRNAAHFYKWYVKSHPISILCTQCHVKMSLSRYKENDVLSSPIVLYIEKLRFQVIRLKQYLYWIMYRPYLELDCSECGEKQIICPYCHKPISHESIECHYATPTKCQHCGRKIYTTLPLQDSNDLIEITPIAR